MEKGALSTKTITFEFLLFYESALRFSDELAWVEKNEKKGYIDQDSNVRIPFIYESALWFSDELARVEKNEKKGYIDQDSNVRIPFIYGFVVAFYRGLEKVRKRREVVLHRQAREVDR